MSRIIGMMRAGLGLTVAAAMAGTAAGWEPVAAGGPQAGEYKVLKPIESGDLTLFPVVRVDGKTTPTDTFLTLDEGLKTGEVEVTEAGKVSGLVRPRGPAQPTRYSGDQVNTLVLVNHSQRPLLLLAGEIVTGGKQDRIIAKDRIVPVGADPIDLSVFCIEHGRWTESSTKFGSSAKAPMESFMVQPTVRQQAMVARDQQQVWNSVSGAIANMAVAAAPPPTRAGGPPSPASLGTTSYAKAMETQAVRSKVDESAAGTAVVREQTLATLRQEHAIGVVAAVRGEIIWADIFSNTALLEGYWTKLVRSYAAEGLNSSSPHSKATIEDAQHFLNRPLEGREDSEGEVGIYRNREVRTNGTAFFALESLLPGTAYDVHISRMKLREPVAEATRPTPSPVRPIFR